MDIELQLSWLVTSSVCPQPNFQLGTSFFNIEVLVCISKWHSSLAMICVGLSDLFLGVRAGRFNQNLVELRNKSVPLSMTNFYDQICAVTDSLHSHSENLCSGKLAEVLHGTLKVRNL